MTAAGRTIGGLGENEAPVASVVITTRNRREDVLRAVGSCVAQDYRPLDVLVYDDASEDGTAESVRRVWPSVRLCRVEPRVGLIANRSRGFREACGEVVFSLDDDAYFSSPHTVSQTMAMFRGDPSIAVVAIPYIEPLARRSLSSLRTPLRAEACAELSTYVGCAHAIRRHVALSLGGYRDFFVHQGEERDMSLRLQNAGWRIVSGNADPIVHMVSPSRDSDRVIFYGARNQILFDVLNLPFPYVLVRLVWDPVAMIRYRFQWSSFPTKVRGISAGFAESVRRIHHRRAVSARAYREFRRLPNHGPVEWAGPVPRPCDAASPIR